MPKAEPKPPHPDAVNISFDEASVIVGLHASTLRKLAKRDVDPLPTVRFGRRVLVVRSLLGDWTLRERERQQGEAA